MLKVSESTAVYGVSELRTKTPDLLKSLKTHRVLLTRRNKPVGVLLQYGEFEKQECIIDEIEDLVLGYIAKERAKSAKRSDYIPLEEVERQLGLRR